MKHVAWEWTQYLVATILHFLINIKPLEKVRGHGIRNTEGGVTSKNGRDTFSETGGKHVWRFF